MISALTTDNLLKNHGKLRSSLKSDPTSEVSVRRGRVGSRWERRGHGPSHQPQLGVVPAAQGAAGCIKLARSPLGDTHGLAIMGHPSTHGPGAWRVKPGRLLSALLLCCCAQAAAQTAVDSESAGFFAEIAAELSGGNVEIRPNLNDRDNTPRRVEIPGLGGFPDLPPDTYPDSAEIAALEAAFATGEIGAVVLYSDSPASTAAEAAADAPGAEAKSAANPASVGNSLQDWLEAIDQPRIFITFAAEEEEISARIQQAARRLGYEARQLSAFGVAAPPPTTLDAVGEFYATAGQRLAIDSRAARRLRTEVTELELLGKRQRRDSVSVFRDPVNRDQQRLSRNEPEIFRKLTLGDEFTRPTIREIVVPGGIALGESAEVDFTPIELVFNGEYFVLRGVAGDSAGTEVSRRLPRRKPGILKALFDLTRRSINTRSDAVVDLDADRRVSISSALRDTGAGYAMLVADTLPFEYLDYLPVTKSVVIDTEVAWRGTEDETPTEQAFETAFEVRFLSADRMRIAQTRLALEYDYDSAAGTVRYTGNWGRDASRLRESTDIEGLGAGLAELADHIGWVALFRRLEQDAVPFLKGRYQFMKIDKTGRATPSRFR